jgi:hypothetical protein
MDLLNMVCVPLPCIFYIHRLLQSLRCCLDSISINGPIQRHVALSQPLQMTSSKFRIWTKFVMSQSHIPSSEPYRVEFLIVCCLPLLFNLL